MAVISISLPDDLLARADRYIDSNELRGRSELVQSAVRDFLNRADDAQRTGRAHAMVTVAYGEDAEPQLARIRHGHGRLVTAMMHSHSDDACVDAYMVDGDTRRIGRFLDELRGVRGVQRVEAAYTSTPA